MCVRVLVADDNAEMLAAVREVLDSAAGVAVVATARSGEHTLAEARAHAPDLVVVDVEMPGGGPDLTRRLVALSPCPRVLALSARDDEETIVAMLAAGATGYVAKGALDEDLAACVRRCAAGTRLVVAGSADRVRQRLADESLPAAGDLARMHYPKRVPRDLAGQIGRGHPGIRR